MGRIVMLVTAACAAIALLGALGGVAGAQTGGIDAFCAARLEANNAHGKKANLAVMDKLVASAPSAVAPDVTNLRALYAKKGDKAFDAPDGYALLTKLEGYVFDNCPGNAVAVTATDYEYSGVPSSLPTGVTKFKLTNAAPKEDHEMIVFKLNAKGESLEPQKLLAMPQDKAQKYVDPSTQTFMYAPAGQTFYAPIELTAGKYLYACFLPQGGKKHGEMHAMLGMYGTFTVS